MKFNYHINNNCKYRKMYVTKTVPNPLRLPKIRVKAVIASSTLTHRNTEMLLKP